MKALAPGTVIFHRHRGYGVITSVNLLTGWIAARFGSEARTLDLNLSTDDVQFADGEAILFRRAPPDRMPHARLMAMVRELHRAGYQKLYLYSWPKPSGLHWRWHLFTGPRDWMQRPWREGWYGSGADYNVNPVMGWGDTPGASTGELIDALARFGGFEIAAMTGAYIAAAQAGLPVIVDGLICTVSALAARLLNPRVEDWFLYGHQSAEPAHARVLEALQAKPLLKLGMRLGEGSGAATAFPLLQLACALHGQMATFAEAGVSGAA